MMHQIGNCKANAKFGGEHARPGRDAPDAAWQDHIRNKYERRMWVREGIDAQELALPVVAPSTTLIPVVKPRAVELKADRDGLLLDFDSLPVAAEPSVGGDFFAQFGV